MIGNLGEEIKQPSNPYANLSERGLRRSQVNALKAMIPDLEPEENRLPHGARDMGDGYILLRARDEFRQKIGGEAGRAIREYLEQLHGPMPGDLSVVRWASLRVPNGQIARSGWKEKQKPLDQVRMARNTKVMLNFIASLEADHFQKIPLDGKHEIAEVQFFFRVEIEGEDRALALVSLYSRPDEQLLKESFNTVWLSQYQGTDHLTVVEAKSILSVVGMVPHQRDINSDDLEYFLVEKPGLDVIFLSGYEEADAPIMV